MFSSLLAPFPCTIHPQNIINILYIIMYDELTLVHSCMIVLFMVKSVALIALPHSDIMG